MRNYLAFVAGSLIFFSASAISLENECGEFARVDGTSYVVSPSGDDDTDVLQCVLDSATSQGIKTIRLDRGTFSSQSLSAVGFEGVFQGTTRSDTTLLIDNRFAVCTDTGGDAEYAAGLITFFGGSPTVKSMTIDVDQPCDRGSIYAVLRFTQESCDTRTFFGVVDRLDIDVGLNSDDISVGVLVNGDVDCVRQEGRGPLGTFKLNRSNLSGINVGTLTSLLGAGQVDINFNEFVDVVFGVEIFDANQNTTITGNTFQYYGLGVVSGADTDIAPTTNRTVVHKNSFEQLGADRTSVGVYIYNGEVRANNSAVITGNTFDVLDGSVGDTVQLAIGIQDVDGALIANNRIRGSADVGVWILGGNFDKAVESTSITGNTFDQENSSGADIWLAEVVSNSVVGPQGAVTDDLGTDNLIGD